MLLSAVREDDCQPIKF